MNSFRAEGGKSRTTFSSTPLGSSPTPTSSAESIIRASRCICFLGRNDFTALDLEPPPRDNHSYWHSSSSSSFRLVGVECRGKGGQLEAGGSPTMHLIPQYAIVSQSHSHSHGHGLSWSWCSVRLRPSAEVHSYMSKTEAITRRYDRYSDYATDQFIRIRLSVTT